MKTADQIRAYIRTHDIADPTAQQPRKETT
jgi:hypothetical protein